MNLMYKLYEETLKDFVDFFRFMWDDYKWQKYARTIPDYDSTDFVLRFFANDWTEEEIHAHRLKKFRSRMEEWERVKWMPRWWRQARGMEIVDKPVFKPFDIAEIDAILAKREEARQLESKRRRYIL